jgi:GTP-binding protein
MSKGLVAIVGRPNVGKSTLFNQLTRSRRAIVDDQPGVTRDRLYGLVETTDALINSFGVIDTGGFETDDLKYQPFAKNIVWENTLAAIDEADLVVLVLDGQSGIHPHDDELVRLLKRKNKPVVYAINKVDGDRQEQTAHEFYELGIPTFETMSAAHNNGVNELREIIVDHLKEIPRLTVKRDFASDAIRLAIVGRPNVGKSSIVNRLVGEDRSIVSDVAGTTRDAMDTAFRFNSKDYVMIDTAGIRRRSRVKQKLEILSVIQSMDAIERANIVLLVIDTTEGLTDQDARIASLAAENHKPVVIVVNKWDLHPDKDSNSMNEFQREIRRRLQTLDYAPMIFVSCLENQRVHKIMTVVESVVEQYEKRVGTGELNRALEEIVQLHTPALIRNSNKRVKFYYATQVRSRPPLIVVMCNVADEIQEHYRRYMERQFQKRLGFDLVPVRVAFRGKEEKRTKAAAAAGKKRMQRIEAADHYEEVDVEPTADFEEGIQPL